MGDDEPQDDPAGSYADKATLIGLGPRLAQADVKVTLNGTVVVLVRVRALSRAEVLDLQKLEASGTLILERRMMALAMVRPRMTEADIRQWQERAPAGELEPITDKIQELSGVGDDVAKDFYRRFEADPAEEFRLLPGGETRDDREADASRDVE